MSNEPNPYQEKKSSPVRFLAIIFTVGLILSFLLSVKSHDDESVYVLGSELRLPGTCYSRQFFDMNCPGCGLTRSIVCISHGQWDRAARFNVGGFAIYLGVLSYLVYALSHRWISLDHFLNRHWFWSILIWSIVGLLIGQWIFKFFLSVSST